MAKKRVIDTRLWTDSRVLEIDPSQKLVWLRLLTNNHLDLSGIFEVSPKIISMETGFTTDILENILQKFELDGKIKRYKNWIRIINFHQYQSLNPSVLKGIERSYKDIPEDIFSRLSAGCIQSAILNLTKLNLTKPKGIGSGDEQKDENHKEPDKIEIDEELRKKYSKELVEEFEDYRNELTPNKKKRKYQLEKTFEAGLRLAKRHKNSLSFKKQNAVPGKNETGFRKTSNTLHGSHSKNYGEE